MKNINVIGACCDLGVHVDGAKNGPIEIEKNIKNINIKNVFPKETTKSKAKNDLKKNIDEIYIYNKELYNTVLNTLENNNFPLTIGGDHSIAVASALASIKKHENIGIIWFDAHGDYNTLKTTTTGNIHGLPFAVLTNFDKDFLTEYHNGNFYNYNNAVLVGARDIDYPYEYDNLKKAGVTIFTTTDIEKYGTDYIYNKAFEIASNNTNGIHISYDLDVIDPTLAPGVSVPVKQGLNLQQAYAFVDKMIENKKIIKSIDLVEYNPNFDKENKTLNIATEIVNKIIDNY